MDSLVTPELVRLDLIEHNVMTVLHKAFEELAVQPSQSPPDSPILIDRAWIGKGLMETLSRAAYQLKLEPLAMEFTELLMNIDDPFDAFHPPDTIVLDTYDPGKPCYFFVMPQELRDMNYDILVSSGNLQILQTSKRVHDESIGLLYKRRICHLKIDTSRYIPKFNLQKPIAALIQNVSVELLDPWDFRWAHNMKPIRKFSGSTVLRQTCRVVLLFTSVYSYLAGHRLQSVMNHLQTFIGFSRLTLQARFRGSAFRKLAGPQWYEASLETYRECLERDLGPSTWHHSADPISEYLEFHPRAHLQANSETMSLLVRRRIDQWEKYPKRARRHGG